MRDEAEVSAQARWDLAIERMTALAEEVGIPVQHAFVDGPAPPWPATFLIYTGSSGMAPDDPAPFSERFELRERQTIRDLADGLLIAYLERLHRKLAMAERDGMAEFVLDLYRRRLDVAKGELAWRQQAGERGAARVRGSGRWRERIEVIRTQTDLGMLIAYECAGAKPAGPGKWLCACPFHDDRSPSLSIDVEKGLWNCFGCHVGGDCFDYVERRQGISFAEALVYLEDRLGIRNEAPPFKVEPVRVWSDGGSGA